MTDRTYVVAGSRPWNRTTFDRLTETIPATWHFVSTPTELTEEVIDRWRPRYIFFLHWSQLVGSGVYERNECVAFHMTDLPDGRGGSPLQHLIASGVRETKLTAFRMTGEVDGGPVYAKAPLWLGGTAESIYIRSDELAASMIAEIIATEPTPSPQVGSGKRTARRLPAESRLPEAGMLDDIESFIRMLDAEGYPRAYIDHGAFRIEFSRPGRYASSVVADARIETRGDRP